MPYQSKAQVRYMHAKHPEIAKRWDGKYGVSKSLPKHKSSKKVRPRKRRTTHAAAVRWYAQNH